MAAFGAGSPARNRLSKALFGAVAAALLSAAGLKDADATVCSSRIDRLFSHYRVENGVVFYSVMKVERDTRVAGADASTFQPWRVNNCDFIESYARDRNAVYYEGVKVQGADPKTFQPVEDPYARDHAWWYGAGVRIASRASGDLKELGAAYVGHPEGIFWGAYRVETEGFEVLGTRGYARSRSRAYFRGKEIPGIDAASFAVFPNAAYIARDRRSVVVDGKVDERLDAGTFEVLTPDAGLARDRSRVYSAMKPVAGADPARFEWLGRGYWRDGRSLFFGSAAIPGADPAAFRFIGGPGGSYATDMRKVYLNGAPLPNVDPATFQVIAFGYAKDRNGLYHYGKPMPGADPGSFSARIDGRGRDRNYGYDYGKRACAWAKEAAKGLPACDPSRYGR